MFKNLKKILSGYEINEKKLSCILQKPHGMVYVTEKYYNFRLITRKKALQRFSKRRDHAFQLGETTPFNKA